MITVTELRRTCMGCPAQWEGETATGDNIYVRYRHGTLRVDLNRNTVFSLDHGEGWAGVMDYDELKALLAGQFRLPDNEVEGLYD